MIEAVFVSVNAPIFLYSTITAPAMAGIASKNAYLAAHCLSNPKRRPADIDEPDLEIPGNKANDSNTPIINEFLKVNPITLLSPRVAKCSDNTNIKPFIMRNTPTATTLLKSASNCFVNKIPTMATGIVPTIRSQANLLQDYFDFFQLNSTNYLQRLLLSL